ncbi:hypothetical protein [Nocardiopsis lambiniae]|uniref:Uncharacterized protein n=1 Tax=Nocardiopsis lambiniae TaxID=3075539 RepID=A0ABU2M994_9ACTN|nr:hypothetical protein [Nocardiopsis sp. DSM 44743]MDT0329234.1 hypothetical protein [Nocardiopsis sp. DSM 44743]
MSTTTFGGETVTQGIASAVRGCLDGARDTGTVPDADALTLLLTAHLELGAPEPGDWYVDDVHEVARVVRAGARPGGPRHPGALRDTAVLRSTWLAWCDHLVDQDGLVSDESPRRLRSAIEEVDLTVGGDRAPVPAPAGAEPLLDRLDGTPPRPIAPAEPGDLDDAARQCRTLADAARLTVWVDRGRLLRPDSEGRDALCAEDVPAAAAHLEASPAEIDHLFSVARSARLLRTTYTRVLAGRAAYAWSAGVPGAVADAWADALPAMTAEHGTTTLLALTDLFLLGRERAPRQITAAYRGRDGIDEERVRVALELLADLKAVHRTDGGFRIGRLGDHCMVRRLRRVGVPVRVTRAIADMDAHEVLSLTEEGRPTDTGDLLHRWIEGRDPDTAAGALLEASTAPGAWHRRRNVTELLARQGVDPETTLRPHLDHPVLGGWVRRLRATGEEPPTSRPTAWALLDDYAVLVEAGLPLPVRDRERLSPHAEHFVRSVRSSGHPAADTVLDRLADGELGLVLARAARRARSV